MQWYHWFSVVLFFLHTDFVPWNVIFYHLMLVATGVMYEGNSPYSILSTWLSYWRSNFSYNSIQLLIISTDLPFIACVINSPCTFTYYLDLANFILESGLS